MSSWYGLFTHLGSSNEVHDEVVFVQRRGIVLVVEVREGIITVSCERRMGRPWTTAYRGQQLLQRPSGSV